MKKLNARLAAWLFLGATLVGCELIANVDRSQLGAGGSAGAATGGTGGETGGTAGGGGAPCTDPATDCPDPGTLCTTAVCASGSCATEDAPAGTACSDAGGQLCDGNGACVECLDPALDCPDPGNECVLAGCTSGACDTSNVTAGTATQAGQLAGDCKLQVCDGAGSTEIVDDDDPTDDLNACTADTCSAGTNVHTPVAGACSDGGGTVCADIAGPKAGQCVECNVDGDCTLPMVCDPANGTNTCVDPQCNDGAQNGTETDVDCGGSCGPCANNLLCGVASDCQSGFCSGTVCAPCGGDVDCAAADFCDAAIASGTCTPDKVDGGSCSAASQCVSDSCADGICCDTACAGTCDACSAATKGQGLDGVCGPIVDGTDPDDECATDAPSSCQQTGMCDGASACELHASGTVCAAPSCAAGTEQAPDLCDGSGQCVDGGSTGCGAFACDALGLACLATCVGNNDCAAGNFCVPPACVPLLGPGDVCSAGNQCASGNCIDGVCCDTACTGTCDACSAAKKGQGADGACGPIAVGNDPDDECIAYACNGGSACESCGDGTLQAGEACDDGNVADGDCCSSTCQIEANCEIEPNGNKTEADTHPVYPVATVLMGSIEPIGDLDYWAFTLPTVSDVMVEVFDGNGPSTCATIDPEAELVAPDGTTYLSTDDDDGPGLCPRIDPAIDTGARHLAAGTYYVRVHHFNGNGTAVIPAYTLRVTFTAVCGDATVEGFEQCDGGPTCDANCDRIPTCGDGFVDGTETCDDTNTTDADGCSSTCAEEAGYGCSGEPSTCTPICGDGLIRGSETCDDTNTASGDGCSSACAEEAGFTCASEPSTCTPICGDGLVRGSETCDDTNTTDADGCSSSCAVEPYFQCTSAGPSTCVPMETDCNDGGDNDGDSLIDAADPDCALPAYFPACGAGESLMVYKSVDVPLGIPDSDATGITTYVTATLAGTITKVALFFDITHTWDSDIDMFLTPPGASQLDVCSDNGGSSSDFTQTLLDSTCATAVSAGAAPFSGCYQPETTFATLAGSSPLGRWSLKVADDASGDTGTLNGWRLAVCQTP